MRHPGRHITYGDAGFSLIEALVALAIFAFAAMALLQVQGEGARATVALEEKLVAEIVADNVLATELTQGPRAPGSTHEGKAKLAGRDWHWVVETKPVPNSPLLAVEVAVTQAETGQEVYRVSALRGVTNGS